MSIAKRVGIGLGTVVVVLVAVAGGIRGYMVWQQGQDLLPEFQPVPDGPRAPTREFLGLQIGNIGLPEAEVYFRGLGATCNNSSFRALMGARRKDVIKKMEEVKASGGDPDTVSGASLVNYRSKKERNPQVRLSCDDVPVTAFADRERAPGEGLYWLMIFDSEKHPLRHTSVSRRINDFAVAGEEWRSAYDNMVKRFGAPSKVVREPPSSGDPFPEAAHYEVRWTFADLEAKLVAFRLGKFVRLEERVEVPWPIVVEVP